MNNLTFSNYARQSKMVCDLEFRSRMVAAEIQSLNELLKWAREYYPDLYKSYSLFYEGKGKDAFEQLWANFLLWRDSGGKRNDL
jgi:hypothetical protein